jgi:hypothetical protein
MTCLTLGWAVFPNFVISRQFGYEKLEKQSSRPFWDRPRRLLARHSASKSEMLRLLCHVIVVNVARHMLPPIALLDRPE